MTKSLGRTPAQRRALDQIGCGNYSPIMAKATRDALLRDGLIEEVFPLVSLGGGFRMTIRQFQMPLHVHIEWCASCSEEDGNVG